MVITSARLDVQLLERYLDAALCRPTGDSYL
jgi:hypothetical protein